jgi:putative SOS response-associated peptidase YedK
MCGRYIMLGNGVFQLLKNGNLGRRMDKYEDLDKMLGELPIFNASPMQRMPVIAELNGELVIRKMQWWLIPHWSKDGKVRVSAFNAKAETLKQSKLFAPYFRSSRCLVPADGFYEWKKTDANEEVKGKAKNKQPMCIRMKDERPFMFAGLFSIWKNEKGEEFPSFAIITTGPNKLMADIHTRMPVILEEKNYEQWLDRDNKTVDMLEKLLVPYPDADMKAYRVSDYVNNSQHEGPDCMKEI